MHAWLIVDAMLVMWGDERGRRFASHALSWGTFLCADGKNRRARKRASKSFL